jgi:hypothetical protein
MNLYRLKRFVERQKLRYRYAPWYVQFRSRSLFSKDRREAFESLATSVESFTRSRLLAVGNEGLIYEGRYKPDPEMRHLLKVSLNKNNRAEWFTRVQETLDDLSPAWLCGIREYGLSEDGRYWYQVQEFVEGLMISRYMMLPPDAQRNVIDPAQMVLELINQNKILRQRRILAPNVDEENLILSPEGLLRRIDLDPYRRVPEEEGEMPRWDFRRLFRVTRKILDPHVDYYRQIFSAKNTKDIDTFENFLRRLANSSVCTYGDPRKKRHGKGVAFAPEDCFMELDEATSMLEIITERND